MRLLSRILVSACVTIVIALQWSPNSAYGQITGKDKVEDVKGARWGYEVREQDSEEVIEKGVFRVLDKVIYKGKNKVGVVNAQSQTETKLAVEGIEKINGKSTLKKTGEKPPVWEGILHHKDGRKLKIKITFRDS